MCPNLQFPVVSLPWPPERKLGNVCFCQICVKYVPKEKWGIPIIMRTVYWTSCHPAFLAILSWWHGRCAAWKAGFRGQSPASCPDAGGLCRCMGRSPRQGCPRLPQRSRRALLQPRWFQFEASTQCWDWIEFLPWNQQDLLQHFAWIKIFVPFFTGQKEDSWSLRRKEIITGPYRSRSCATAARSLRGRNIGPQTWSATLSKCLWAAQGKPPSEAYLITSICNRLNVRSGVLGVCTYFPGPLSCWNRKQQRLAKGI